MLGLSIGFFSGFFALFLFGTLDKNLCFLYRLNCSECLTTHPDFSENYYFLKVQNMERITRKTLDAYCEMLNRFNGHQLAAWRRTESGELIANVGSYYVSASNGGYNLAQMANESGGISLPLAHGHVPARELYNLMRAYSMGIERQKMGDA